MFKRRLLSFLEEWKDKTTRKPLVLRGARQVGKTSLLKYFGENYFQNFIYINLEKQEHLRMFRKDLSVNEFEQILKVFFKQNLVDGKTLIFFDELQNSRAVVKLLRFLYEERPELHVVTAGSLLEVKIKQEGFSLPVGRVEFAYLYPLDFFEFLEAKKEQELLEFLKIHSLDKPILESIHNKALGLFREYSMIGGMPEVVKAYVADNSLENVKRIYASLFQTYLEDLNKYSSSGSTKYMLHVLENAPLHAGEIVSYQGFSGSNYKFREMSEAFDVLEKVLLLKMLPATNSKKMPLVGKNRRPKKLLFLDFGFVNYYADLFNQFLNTTQIEDIYRGRLVEQIVGQNILAQYQFHEPNIYFWAKEKREGSAEVDFSLIIDGKIVGVEVKAGLSSKFKSLMIFKKEVENSRAIHFYSGNIANHKLYRSLPLYLVPRILEAI